MKQTALFPGTFDPPTLGHLDIIARASRFCDTLIVGVAAISSKKAPLFSIDERVEMLKEICKDLSGVKIIPFVGLVADFCEVNQISFLVRGLRAFSDFDYELSMALTNRKLGSIETLFLVADETLAHVSSTLIRDIGSAGRHLEPFLPQSLLSRVYERIRHSSQKATE